MAHDPVLNPDSLKEAFKQAAGRGLFAGRFEEHTIPDNREPEVSFLLNDIGHVHNIYDTLSRARDIVIIPGSSRVNSGTLVSLGQDTVDNEGYPLREIEAAGYTLRTRFSLAAFNRQNIFLRFDRSAKSIEKNDFRKEWETECKSPQDGHAALIANNPTLPAIFHQVDPNSFRVSGVCLTARAVYSFLHIVDENTAVLYDACNDACVLTTPYADSPVGYRREFEYEAKAIHRKGGMTASKEEFNALLNKSIDMVRSTISAGLPGQIHETNESKLAHTQRAVREHYESQMGNILALSGNPRIKDGTDHALSQNVLPRAFMYMPQRENIRMLSKLIPASTDLQPGKTGQDYSRFFDSECLHKPLLRLVAGGS